jgi:hypothetical protein
VSITLPDFAQHPAFMQLQAEMGISPDTQAEETRNRERVLLHATHLDAEALVARVKRDSSGYLTSTELAALRAVEPQRLTQVLVRCGTCRFTCAIQDTAFLIAAVEAHGDYMRDVSLR